jgi:general stress protein 26
MDSINKQQEEKNHEDLQSKEGIEKVKELAGKTNTCFFATKLMRGEPLAVRPMAVQKIDDEGNMWFLSASDSYKNKEIMEDNKVQLFFQGSSYSDFLSVSGTASISTDKAIIKELWNPMIKTWFTEGVDDPRITVIKVDIQDGYYWDNKHGNMIAFIKTAAGAVLGKTMDDSIEGNIKL